MVSIGARLTMLSRSQVRASVLIVLFLPLLLCCSINRQYGYRPGDPLEDFPEWPPPDASSYYTLPASIFASASTVGQAVTLITTALDANGYSEKGFYSTKDGGLAIVTRREPFADDGSSLPPNERWSARPSGAFTLIHNSYVAKRYRVFVFLVGPVPPVERSTKTITREEASKWWRDGRKGLPPEVAERPLGKANSTVLAYEFEGGETKTKLVMENAIPAQTHLQKNGVLASLTDRR
jgi:hypothetical protein